MLKLLAKLNNDSLHATEAVIVWNSNVCSIFKADKRVRRSCELLTWRYVYLTSMNIVSNSCLWTDFISDKIHSIKLFNGLFTFSMIHMFCVWFWTVFASEGLVQEFQGSEQTLSYYSSYAYSNPVINQLGHKGTYTYVHED